MTQEEFDQLYPEGSLIRQEKLRELEDKPGSVGEAETPVEPVVNSDVPEEVWRGNG